MNLLVTIGTYAAIALGSLAASNVFPAATPILAGIATILNSVLHLPKKA